MTENELRAKVVATAQKYLGCKESDGSHRKIIDIYNAVTPRPRGYKVTYTDAWCATFVSAVAYECGVSDIMFPECGCEPMIALYKKAGRWQENDAHVPQAGDVIMYDWQDSGVGDNTGGADHVGIVVSVSGNTIKVIEGNKSNSVSYRNLTVNGRYIRGYCLPNYASKATASGGTDGGSGNGSSGSGSGTASGGSEINRTVKKQGVVKGVSPDDLNVRTWAGTQYPRLKTYPSIAEGTKVGICDEVKDSGGAIWYFVKIGGSKGEVYGFVHSKYIQISGATAAQKELKVGDTVQFTGSTHYTSSYASAKGYRATACTAKITAINKTGAHPYHVVNDGGKVHGWVNASDIA